MIRLTPPAHRLNHGHAVLVELASERPIRHRNKLHYRIAHGPVWAFAFFILPGPITFTVFAQGLDNAVLGWLAVVAAATTLAGVAGRLPGTEPRPYVLLYGEDTPNPLHRRVCYTIAWSGIVSYAMLNAASLVDAVVAGAWRAQQIYGWGYFPIAGLVWLVGIAGRLPRAKASTQAEGLERRHFYAALWAVSVAQVVLLVLWKALPVTPATDVLKLTVYAAALAITGHLGRRGLLPRTRPILPGTRAAAD